MQLIKPWILKVRELYAAATGDNVEVAINTQLGCVFVFVMIFATTAMMYFLWKLAFLIGSR